MQKYRALGVVLGMLGFVGQAQAMDDGCVGARSRINAIGDDGDTQLHKAVRRGAVRETERLLDLGADPNVVDDLGYMPFYYASRGERFKDSAVQKELIRLLYFAGADDPSLTRKMLPNATEEFYHYIDYSNYIDGRFSCRGDYNPPEILGSEIREYIYTVGLNFRQNIRVFCELKDQENPLTPLSQLLFPEFFGIVKGYVGSPHDVEDGKLVYIHPLQLRITKLLGLEDAEKQAICLWNTCGGGDTCTPLELLFAGVDPNYLVKHTARRTFLHEATKNGCMEIVRLLLANRAEVNAQDQEGNTPLWEAARVGLPGIAGLLLAHNASVDLQGRDDKTPLFAAVMEGKSSLVRLLLEHRADTEIKSTFGDTPLQYAQILRKKAMVRLLKAHEAREKKKVSRGQEQKQCCVVS